MTGSLSPAALEQMTAWHARRASFAMMGEYSSGKSTLLNVLLGRKLLPTKVTATDLPAIWITKGDSEKLQGLAHDGTLHDLTIDDLTSKSAMDYLVIRIESDAEILSRADIIDTPGISDPRMSTAIVQEIAAFCDFVIWCSPATQAWRQTEKAFWKSLPQRLHESSILAVTRADKLRSSGDTEKVIRRCRSETGDSFSAVVPISTPIAMAALDSPDSGEFGAQWKISGAEALHGMILKSIEAADIACTQRQSLQNPLPISRPARGKAKKETKEKADKPKTAPASRLPVEVMATLKDIRNSATDFSNKDRILDTISHLSIKIRNDEGLSEDQRNVLLRCLAVEKTFSGNVIRVVEQIGQEFAEFSESAWYQIGR